MADFTSTSCATNAVHVIFVGLRRGIVDDMCDVRDVNAAGCNVGSDQNRNLVFLKSSKGALALALRFAAVDGFGLEAAQDKFFAKALNSMFSVVKHNELAVFDIAL